MGLLSKANILLKAEQAKINAAKKLSTTTIKPTASINAANTKTTTIQPMATPKHAPRPTTPVVAKPTTIKLTDHPQVKQAAPVVNQNAPIIKPTTPIAKPVTPVVKPTAPVTKQAVPTTVKPAAQRLMEAVQAAAKVEAQKPANTMVKPATQPAPVTTVNQNTQQPATAETKLTQSTIQNNNIQTNQPIIENTMQFFNNSLKLNPNRHTSGLIPVSHKPVHPVRNVAANTQARTANVAGNHQQNAFYGSRNNQPQQTNQQQTQPTMVNRQEPKSIQSSTMPYGTLRPNAVVNQSSTYQTSINRPNNIHPTRPITGTPNYSTRPTTITMTRPGNNTTTTKTAAPRPATKKTFIQNLVQKFAKKKNRVVAKKMKTLEKVKLVSSIALLALLQLGTVAFIVQTENMEFTYKGFHPEELYPNKIEQVAKPEQNKQITATNTTTITVNNKTQVATKQVEKTQQTKSVQQVQPAQNTVVEKSIQQFTQGLQSQFTQRDREVFAQMIYGEAGRGVDPFEVGHVALNRLASGRFGKTLTAVITAKRQFDGFSEKHPIDKDCLAIANELIAEFEANDCKPFCDYYYFYTHPDKHLGAKYNRNIFMSGVEWRPYARENYSEKYCSKANEHAAHYHAQRNKEKAATHIAALTK